MNQTHTILLIDGNIYRNYLQQQNVNGDLPTMVHTAPRSPDDDSDSGEFDTHSDSPLNMSNGVASLQGDSDDSSSDDGETDAVGAGE